MKGWTAAGLSLIATATLSCGGVLAQSGAKPPKPIKIWNLTASTITDFRLAPAGSPKFGRNLALDDKDKEIDVDERLTLRDIAPGTYDARLQLRNGRECRVVGLRLEAGEIASVEEKDLVSCLRTLPN